jgi:hypothetical protein
MGDVLLAIAMVRYVLDWDQGCSACEAQPFLVGLLSTPPASKFTFLFMLSSSPVSPYFGNCCSGHHGKIDGLHRSMV